MDKLHSDLHRKCHRDVVRMKNDYYYSWWLKRYSRIYYARVTECVAIRRMRSYMRRNHV